MFIPRRSMPRTAALRFARSPTSLFHKLAPPPRRTSPCDALNSSANWPSPLLHPTLADPHHPRRQTLLPSSRTYSTTDTPDEPIHEQPQPQQQQQQQQQPPSSLDLSKDSSERIPLSTSSTSTSPSSSSTSPSSTSPSPTYADEYVAARPSLDNDHQSPTPDNQAFVPEGSPPSDPILAQKPPLGPPDQPDIPLSSLFQLSSRRTRSARLRQRARSTPRELPAYHLPEEFLAQNVLIYEPFEHSAPPDAETSAATPPTHVHSFDAQTWQHSQATWIHHLQNAPQHVDTSDAIALAQASLDLLAWQDGELHQALDRDVGMIYQRTHGLLLTTMTLLSHWCAQHKVPVPPGFDATFQAIQADAPPAWPFPSDGSVLPTGKPQAGVAPNGFIDMGPLTLPYRENPSVLAQALELWPHYLPTKAGIWSKNPLRSIVTAEKAINAELDTLPPSAPNDPVVVSTIRRPLLVFAFHNYGEKQIPRALLRHAATAAGADLIHLDAMRASHLIGNFVGQDWAYAKGPIAMLGFQAAEAAEVDAARKTWQVEAQKRGEEEHRTTVRDYSWARHLEKKHEKWEADLDKLRDNAADYQLPCLDQWDSLKVNSALRAITEAADRKTNGNGNRKLIIHLDDYAELSSTAEGLFLLERLRGVVDGQWMAGKQVILVGSTCRPAAKIDQMERWKRLLATSGDYGMFFHVRQEFLDSPFGSFLQKLDYVQQNTENLQYMMRTLELPTYIANQNLLRQRVQPFRMLHDFHREMEAFHSQQSATLASEQDRIKALELIWRRFGKKFQTVLETPWSVGVLSAPELYAMARRALSELRQRPAVSQLHNQILVTPSESNSHADRSETDKTDKTDIADIVAKTESASKTEVAESRDTKVTMDLETSKGMETEVQEEKVVEVKNIGEEVKEVTGEEKDEGEIVTEEQEVEKPEDRKETVKHGEGNREDKENSENRKDREVPDEEVHGRSKDEVPNEKVKAVQNLDKQTSSPSTDLGWKSISSLIQGLPETYRAHKPDSATVKAEEEESDDAHEPAKKTREQKLKEMEGKLDSHEEQLLPGWIDKDELTTTFDDIHLPPETIVAIDSMTVLPLQRSEEFTYGVLARERISGCLLYGPPGTGKTLLARAVAKQSGVNMLEVSASSINDMWVGQSEKNVSAVFSLAKKLAPVVIFIDEADALLGKRMQRTTGNHRETLNEFLRELDGLRSSKTFLMVATNRPYDLDEAVLRRLPRKILVDLPRKEDRLAILRILLKDERLADDVRLEDLAQQTQSYSGSDLKNMCVSAAVAAIREAIPPTLLASAKGGASAESRPAAGASALSDGAESVPPEKRRVLHPRHFEHALREISANISDDMATVKELRKFHATYGSVAPDGEKKRKKMSMGFEPMMTPAPTPTKTEEEPGRIGS